MHIIISNNNFGYVYMIVKVCLDVFKKMGVLLKIRILFNT
jgi:hypothetical protein